MRKFRLDRRVAVVTGGGRGIGLATARALAAEGARVAIGDIDGDLAQQGAERLKGFGATLDVRDRESFAHFIDATRAELGPVDILVNNAGIMPAGPFTEEPDELSDAQIDINLRGVILGCKLVLSDMLQRGQGRIVNIASMAGVLPVPGLSVYCATKFAVVGLTQSLREEYRDSGVMFSSILPAKVTTDLAAGTERAGRGVPTSTPEEVAAAVVDAIRLGRTEVMVPRYMGVTPALLDIAPMGLQRGFRRLFGDRRVLEQLDHAARADYERRIGRLAK